MSETHWDLFTDGSSFMDNSVHEGWAKYTVVTGQQVLEAAALLPVSSAQKAELIALT
jgi:hypothetical protein